MPYVKNPNGRGWKWVEPEGSGLAPLQDGQVRVITGQQRLQAAGIDPTTAREGDPGLTRQQNAALSAMGRSDEAALYENNGGQYGSALTDALRGRTVNRGPQQQGRSLVQGGSVGARMPSQGGQVNTAVQPGQTTFQRQGVPSGVQSQGLPASNAQTSPRPPMGGNTPPQGIPPGMVQTGMGGAGGSYIGGSPVQLGGTTAAGAEEIRKASGGTSNVAVTNGGQGGMAQPAVQPGQTTFQPPTTNGMGQGGGQVGTTLGGSPVGTYGASGMGPASQVPSGQSQQGQNFVPPASYGDPQSGLAGAEQAFMAGAQNATGIIQRGEAQGRGDLMQAAQGANNTLNPYYQPGSQSNNYQAALSGALGMEAQQQAMDRFMNSPGQQYLLDESERAIRRNAAATGGLGGANVQRALQENAIGLAAQDFDNAFNRLGSISDRGLAAGGQISNNAMTTGQNLANLGQNAMGLNAGILSNLGNTLGAGRTRAGEMIAGNIQDGSSNLANIMLGTGNQMSGVIGDGSTNLANLLAGSGQDMANYQVPYAQLLAQISQNTGNQIIGLPALGGTQNATGALDGVGNFLGGIGSILPG